MKKRFKSITSSIIIISLLLTGIPCLSETEKNKEQIDSIPSSFKEIEKPFESDLEWKEHLENSNKDHQDSNLEHDKIQDVLEKRGISGLSKYQYQRVLSEEKPTSFLLDELLISFNGTYQSFKNKMWNDVVASWEHKENFSRCILKQEYSEEQLISLIGEMINDPYVNFIQPNFTYKEVGFRGAIDYTYTLTQAMEQVAAPTAWDYTLGEDVVVGVVDSGISSIAGTGIDIYSGSSDECSKASCPGHGTAVSTIIGGDSEYIGVAPNCEILCLGTHDHNEGDKWTTWSFSEITEKFNAANCKIINMSLGPAERADNTNLDSIYQTILLFSNALIVNSAGNENFNLDNGGYTYYSLPNYICVAAVDRYDNLASFSNYGLETVHIAAPGVDLSLPDKDGNLGYWEGTSFAAPFVAGTAALLLAANPGLTVKDLKNIILNTADVVPGLEGKIQGGRRLNVGEAVRTRNTANGNRSAIITNDGVLKVCENGSNGWVTIASNVKNVVLESGRVIYQLNNNNIYCRYGELESSSIAVDTTGTATGFAASGQNLVIYDGTNLSRYGYSSSAKFVYVTKYTNISYYSLRGNRLVLTYKSSPKKFRVWENAYNKSTVYTDYTVDANITGIYMIGSRIHILQSGGGYTMFDSIKKYNSKMELQPVFSQTSISSCSMNQSRWCCVVSGSKINLYTFDTNGNRKPTPTVINAPDGQTIESCLIENYRVYFKCGKNLYRATGEGNNVTISQDSRTMSAFAVKGTRIGILNTDGIFLHRYTASNQNWVTMHTGVKKIVLGS